MNQVFKCQNARKSWHAQTKILNFEKTKIEGIKKKTKQNKELMNKVFQSY